MTSVNSARVTHRPYGTDLRLIKPTRTPSLLEQHNVPLIFDVEAWCKEIYDYIEESQKMRRGVPI